MATFLPIRGTQSEIDATAIVDGQLLFTTDTNNIYIDNGTTRTLYRSVSTVQLSSQNTTADAIAFGKDSSGNYGYYEAGSSELKSFKKGNATVAQVLSPYTFSNASASGLTGTMANRGSLTFNPSSSTTQSLPMGYYSGGTLSTVNAYNAGFSYGYAAGYEEGIAYAKKHIIANVSCETVINDSHIGAGTSGSRRYGNNFGACGTPPSYTNGYSCCYLSWSYDG